MNQLKSWSSVLLLLTALLGPFSFAQVTILEFKEVEDTDVSHGESVHWIACQKTLQSCHLQYVDTFIDPTFVETFLTHLKTSRVVNMSFAIQKPESMIDHRPSYQRSGGDEKAAKEKFESVLAEYYRDSKTLTTWIRENNNVLFVAAAGNGIPIAGGFQSKGVALNSETLLYPQILEEANLVKVASIDQAQFNIANPVDYKLADYSNYGLDLVEIAAPVEANKDGLFQGGTSFAAPYVTRLVDDINKQNPSLSAAQIRGVLLRSCHIKNVERAIWANEDLKKFGKESVVYQAQFNRKRLEREKLQFEVLSDITLVACGGVVSRELALSCARTVAQKQATTSTELNESCAESQAQALSLRPNEIQQLKRLWEIREF
jgi:Subtilase family